MSKYYAPYKVSEGPNTRGHFSVYDANTLKVVGYHDRRIVAQARNLNQAFTDFVNDGGFPNP